VDTASEALWTVDCMVWMKYNIPYFRQNPQATASADSRWESSVRRSSVHEAK